MIKELYDLEQKLGNNTKVNETYYKIKEVLDKVGRNLKILNEFINSTNVEVLKELDIAKKMSKITTLEDLMKLYKEQKDYLKNNDTLISLITKLENLNARLKETVNKDEILIELKNVFPKASEIDLKKIFTQTINETVFNAKEIFDKMVPIINKHIINSIDKKVLEENNKTIEIVTKLSNVITDIKTKANNETLIKEKKEEIALLTQQLENSLLSLSKKVIKSLDSLLLNSLDDEKIDKFLSEYKKQVETLMNSIKTFIKESNALINGTFYDYVEYFKNFDEKAMVENVTSILKTNHDELIETLNKEYLNKNIFEIYVNVSAKINLKLKLYY